MPQSHTSLLPPPILAESQVSKVPMYFVSPQVMQVIEEYMARAKHLSPPATLTPAGSIQVSYGTIWLSRLFQGAHGIGRGEALIWAAHHHHHGNSQATPRSI